MHILCKFLCLLFAFNVHFSTAQKSDRTITSEQAKKDIEWLKNMIQDVHIDVFSLIDSAEFSNSYLNVLQQIEMEETYTQSELYTLILPFFYQINDVHSFLRPPLKIRNKTQNIVYFMPIQIYFYDNAIHLSEPYGDIPGGAKIISINGVPDTTIAYVMLSLSPSDGENIYTKKAYAEMYFSSLFPFVFQLNKLNEIQYISNENKTDTITTLFEGIKKPMRTTLNTSKTANVNFHSVTFYNPIKTAYFKISSFLSDTEEDYRCYLKFIFAQIQKRDIEHLILDLRGNQGGYTARGKLLLSYLTNEPIPFIYSIVYKNSQFANDIVNKKTNDIQFLKRMHLLPELIKLSENDFGTFDTVFFNQVSSKENSFNGKIFILIDGLTASTSGLVCNSLRIHSGAVFIGEPGGFTPTGTFGQVLPFQLPHSKISGHISTIRFNSTSDFQIGQQPFIPDWKIIPTIEDILQKKDVVLEATISLIKEKYFRNSTIEQ